MGRDGYDREDPQCKSCDEDIEGDVVMLHGRFPMHEDCYLEVVSS